MTCRVQGQKRHRGAALPAYSVDTVDEAQALITLACVKSYDNTYRIPGFPVGDLAGMDMARERLALCHSRMRK